ncbi:hypothetical protein [Cupriavidus basilensis]|uniref:hypothetical protein n=1 Tax=Cupriavidus basilensis TaxID=68895 RepID=UPI0005B89A43|nr:hypothetical protein [Cupriavidus basilensis]
MSEVESNFLGSYRRPVIRVLMVLGAVCAFFGVLKAWPRQSGILIMVGVLIYCGWTFVRRLRALRRQASFAIFRRACALMRAVRRVNAITPEVEALQILAQLLCIVAFGILMLPGFASTFGILSIVVAVMACVGSLLDLLQKTASFTKYAWARVAGKVMLATTGSLALCLANISARHVIHAITHLDPKSFPDFHALLVIGLLPLMYVLIVSGMIVIWCAANMMLMWAIWFAAQVLQALWPPLWDAQTKEQLIYRIWHGKRLPAAHADTKQTEMTTYIMRYVSVIGTVVFFIAFLAQTLVQWAPDVERGLRSVLLLVEYKADSRCEGVEQAARVAYLDGKSVSVARKSPGGWTFTEEECHVAQRA